MATNVYHLHEANGAPARWAEPVKLVGTTIDAECARIRKGLAQAEPVKAPAWFLIEPDAAHWVFKRQEVDAPAPAPAK